MDNEAFAQNEEAPPHTTDGANTQATATLNEPTKVHPEYDLPSNTQAKTAPQESLSVNLSLVERIKAAKANSTGIASFIRQVFLGSIGIAVLLILMVILVGVPVAMIVIGAMYVDDCPGEPMVPIYLLNNGCAVLGLWLFTIAWFCLMKENHTNVYIVIIIFMIFFIAGWFIAGCVFIYRSNKDHLFDNPKFCSFTLFHFTFWLNNSVFILCSLITLYEWCSACWKKCRNRNTA